MENLERFQQRNDQANWNLNQHEMRKMRAKSMVTQIKHNENLKMKASNSALHNQFLKKRESELLKKNETFA